MGSNTTVLRKEDVSEEVRKFGEKLLREATRHLEKLYGREVTEDEVKILVMIHIALGNKQVGTTVSEIRDILLQHKDGLPTDMEQSEV